jgi:hypothetical protein
LEKRSKKLLSALQRRGGGNRGISIGWEVFLLLFIHKKKSCLVFAANPPPAGPFLDSAPACA